MAILKAVAAKRPKTVIDHIIKHGFVTTEELKEQYGYNHPPRAARDVREQGIPLDTFKVKDSTGRSIGAYRFAGWASFRTGVLRGRRAFSKKFKTELVEKSGSKCHICSGFFPARYLQIDHRVPYEVAGDETVGRNPDRYMLLCSSCNRAKSWSCEHCENWRTAHDVAKCQTCYWASPLEYSHIGLRDIRRLSLVWQDDEVSQFDAVKDLADDAQQDMPSFVKKLLVRAVKHSE